MIKINFTILIFSFILKTLNSMAQTPINDSAWVIQPSLCDSFNGTSINTSKWIVSDSVSDKGLEMMFNRNVVVSGGTVKIKVDTLNPNRTLGATTYQYQSGTFKAVSAPFRYGYLEINAKFPVGHRAYWSSFWVWAANCGSNWYEEMDIVEITPDEVINKKKYLTNMYEAFTLSCFNKVYYTNTVSNLPRLDSSFHKYAMQWDADNITYFFDDSIVDYLPNSVTMPTPQHFLTLVFDIYVFPGDPPGTWPHMPSANFEIDYFNYYKLNVDCSNFKIISDPNVDYYTASPARAVKQYIITTTVGASSPTFNLSDQCTLRATDYILLDEGTTLNASGVGQFSAIVTRCPN